MLASFDLLMPRTLAEALKMLADFGPAALPIAGGTNVLVGVRAGHCRPAVLVDVGRLAELAGIRQENGCLAIGAGVTIAGLLADPLVAAHAALLRQAAAVFANPLIRNRATIGGNLADASPAADCAPPLLALDAEVELASTAGARRVALAHFFTGVRQTVRRPDELLVAVRWPLRGGVGAFHKLGLRRADAISVVSAAVMVDFGPRTAAAQQHTPGIETARIALGAVAPSPLRATAAEEFLASRSLTPDAIAEAARLATTAVRPISDIRGPAEYRERMVEVMVRRLLGHIGDQQELRSRDRQPQITRTPGILNHATHEHLRHP
jgi:CO/xanthine dehydrogenase FAD-binding subunit